MKTIGKLSFPLTADTTQMPKAMERLKKKDRTRTREGLLIDANGWSEQDWADLHHAVDGAIEKIRARHSPRGPA
jgi:hypothetical protein